MRRMGKEINRVVYIRRINAIIVPFSFKTLHKVADRQALIDCRASENFIDIDTWKELKIRRFRLQKPITVYNVDGTKNSQGTLKYYCWLKVRIGEREEKMMFFLTGLGKERFILGYPFFWAFEPRIDWRKGRVLEGKISIETMSFRKAQDRLQEIQEKALKEHGRPAEGQVLYIRKTTTSQKWAHQAKDARTEETGRNIPREYQRHWRIFDETLAERYPPQRSEDLRIKLHEGVPKTINCKVYPLNRQETDILQAFLAEEERKGYIVPGNSPYTAPVFFVGKKDSKELRPVMDYREINKWTV